jgi:hypothetical protein
MPADLPQGEFRKLVTLMLGLHADFRRRHGLGPPPRNAWTLLEQLGSVKAKAALNRSQILHSPRRGVGPAIEAVRRVLWKTLKPVFDRQTEVNEELIVVLEALAQERQQNRNAAHALSSRVTDLETTVARLRERAE